MSRITALCEWLLRQAAVWGAMACLAFYALVVHQMPESSVLHRYFTGQGWEVKVITAGMFFVGAATLTMKLVGLAMQWSSLHRVGLRPAPPEGNAPDDAPLLLRQLDDTSAANRDGYLYRRLRAALQSVAQKGSADGLEDQLHHLEDAAADEMHQSYGSIRVIASVIPILGFLGTVIGITLAIAELSAADIEAALPAVISGLSVAFDTTAQALALSILLLFAKYGVERVEAQLLTSVDEMTSQQLLGRFRTYGTASDPHVASIKRMCEQMLTAVERTTSRQEDSIAKSLAAANKQWSEMAGSVGEMVTARLGDSLTAASRSHAAKLNEGVARHTADLESTLIRHAEILADGIDRHTAAFATSLENHAQVLTQAETEIAEENRRHLAEVEAAVGEAMLISATRQEKLIQQSEELLKEMQVSLVEAADSTVSQQEQLVRQGDMMLKVIEAAGDIRRLEDALNSNLNALAGAHHFEETVINLSAALQLLTAALGKPVKKPEAVQLKQPEPSQQQAA